MGSTGTHPNFSIRTVRRGIVAEKQRLHFLDHLKILLATIVILVHAAQPYGPGGDWFIKPPPILPLENVIILGMFLGVSASFFMGLFFFVSACFLPGSYDRKGGWRFLRDRLIRLGIPLIVLTTTLLPLLGFLFYNPSRFRFTEYYLRALHPAGLSFGYLWFLVLLIIFAVGYVCWRRLRIPIPQVPAPRTASLAGAAVLLGLATFTVRIWFPFDDWVLFHAFEPAHLPQYLFLFIAGVLAYRNHWLDTLPSTLARIWGLIVIAGILLLPPVFLTFGNAITGGGFTLASFTYAFWESFVGIGICICLVILFRDRWNRPGSVTGMLAQNVYAVYLIHLPVVVSLQWILIPVALPLLLKFFVAGLAGIVLCFALSQYGVRRIPGAERVLYS
jgi:glucan biosynthesis protein C